MCLAQEVLPEDQVEEDREEAEVVGADISAETQECSHLPSVSPQDQEGRGGLGLELRRQGAV